MFARLELKLQDLAKIALGAPELTNVNVAVLQSLLEILLKKLDCQNEKVSLSAYEAKSLHKILEKSKISPLAFNDEKVAPISQKLERLENLEERVNSLEVKLQKHLDEIKAMSNLKGTRFAWENWDTYGCEDLCTVCDPENELACKLIKNTDFLKKLLRRISAPMIDRMFYFEDKINQLHEEFTKFLKRAEEEYLKIELLQTCIEEIELLRTKINENHTQFLATMEEVQDMLDAKLDKIHMPALKKYIRDRFNRIDQDITYLQTRKHCPRAAGIIMEGVRCVSCGGTKVCSEVGVETTAMLPDARPKYDLPAEWLKQCGCSKFITLERDRKEYVPTAPSVNLSEMVSINRPKQITGKTECDVGQIEFVEGLDGNLYRKG
uniref:Uncharacterized protein n=1 Tax=Glossina palpalis gambiensis TaxID=67801 RepID=A0A1B0C6G8_9MUSC